MELEGNLMRGIRLSTDALPHGFSYDGSPLRLDRGIRPNLLLVRSLSMCR